MASMQNEVGSETYERIRALIQGAFPGPSENASDAIVDGVIREMRSNWNPAYEQLGLTRGDGAPRAQALQAEAAPSPEVISYYVGNATHARKAAPWSQFVGHLPLVRVALRATDKSTIQTAIGQVESGDHLMFSVADVNAKWSDHLGYDAERVELITPPRAGGSRFGAIAVYLGYRSASDTSPCFYVLEAGMATGQAKMLYFSPAMGETIFQQSWYKPTQFSEPTHWYRGTLTMQADAPNEPETLDVQALVDQTAPLPYVEVTVQYAPADPPKGVWPEALTVDAALRIAAICDALGMQMDGIGILTPILAALGRQLPWLEEPVKGSST